MSITDCTNAGSEINHPRPRSREWMGDKCDPINLSKRYLHNNWEGASEAPQVDLLTVPFIIKRCSQLCSFPLVFRADDTSANIILNLPESNLKHTSRARKASHRYGPVARDVAFPRIKALALTQPLQL